ncbi:hypothetical protein BOTBODRAFT_174609 [Botryobasidium botryosum FD-172 SS1]|uniref:T6SS Phospholipase effector Tle1-like catalytic domain-containing protein n=1 Tax=Botryobasidium botryosum (strain FD-172 SS1) TaxID=930990 RepID=A0A067MJ86_BOTB1|nr:hypothetical protein BOTBODRAFT_174609 [Botryobasidium botryosum FD-172 SS1]
MSIDPTKKHRTHVLCFDGTSNLYADANTNVVKLFSFLRKDVPMEQMVYYQAGIGTYINPGVMSPLLLGIAKLLDQGVAWYLDAHVMGGYAFLMENYHAGDKIALFGFSRGAYTARALAGMLHKVGLLPRSMPEQVPFAYRMFKDNTRKGWRLSQGFKSTFSNEVKIDFMGVWDTVSSVGLIIPRNLPFTSDNTVVKIFRHALSLDERRAKFKANMWHWPSAAERESRKNNPQRIAPPEEDGGKHMSREEMTDAQKEAVARAEMNGGAEVSNSSSTPPAGTPGSGGLADKKKSTGYSDQWGMGDVDDDTSNVLEVWFAGCHSDVGGGSVKDTEPHALANISLRWMVRQCIEAQCGILFDTAALQAAGIQPQLFVPKSDQLKLNLKVVIPPGKKSGGGDTTDEEVDARRSVTTDEGYGTDIGGANNPSANGNGNPEPESEGKTKTKTKKKKKTKHVGELTLSPSRDNQSPVESLEDRESKDALAPIHDSLKERRIWWILEFIPLMRAWQAKDGAWLSALTVNLGRGRKIPPAQIPPKFHKSVQLRMARDSSYKPQAQWDGEPDWVE